MLRDAYHHLLLRVISTAASPGVDPIARLLADARAGVLHRVGLSSAGLRQHGMRLVVESDPLPQMRATEGRELAAAVRVIGAGPTLVLGEALYFAGEEWQPLWQGESHVRISGPNGKQPLPEAVKERAGRWVGLIRGAVPVDDAGASAANGRLG